MASEKGSCIQIDDCHSISDDDVEDRNQIGQNSGTNVADEEHELVVPCVGMEFVSDEVAYTFYNDYAKVAGFGIRKRFIRRSKMNGEIIGRTYVCSKEGKKRKNGNVENPRPETRVDCKAMFTVRRLGTGNWILTKIVKEHNHGLEPQYSRFFLSHRNINSPVKNVIRTMHSAGVQVPQIMATLSKQSGGIRNVGFTEKDCRNLIAKEKRESLPAGDAQAIASILMSTQLKDPRFFYTMELDEGHIRNIFWVDARSRMAYMHFGDVVTFDTTYLTNKYAMKFAPFVGVNHHGQSILLGCALLTDETTESFVWVFKTWLMAMGGEHPKAIITDQDPAMKAAIKQVFPDTCHRLCLWHIMKKIPEKLGSVCKANPGFMYKFDRCIYDSLTIDEFEDRWKSLLERYKLEDHEWLNDMYKIREQWIPVFLKGTFFAGMSTSQRSESINSFFDGYVDRKTGLTEFFGQSKLASDKRYNDEEKADFDTRQNSPHLKTASPYEAQMAPIYTLGIFKKFQDEVLLIPSCFGATFRLEGETEHHVIREVITKPNGKKALKDFAVVWNGSTNDVSCICRLFEFRGFLCRHAMVFLLSKGVFEIPSKYILKRWTMDAKVMDIFYEECTEANEFGPEYKAKCYTDLCVDCIKLAEEGSLSKQKYMAAKECLKEALAKLHCIEGVKESSLNLNVQDGSQVAQMVPNIVIRDPKVTGSKGGQKKRIKSGLEINKSKGKRRCSHCREPGHFINRCKKLKEALKDITTEKEADLQNASLDSKMVDNQNCYEEDEDDVCLEQEEQQSWHPSSVAEQLATEEWYPFLVGSSPPS